MSAPTVSVLVPNYNHEQYLPARIESVLNQSFSDFEVLLMDDCSSDNSQAILEAYAKKDSRIRLLFNEQNSGSTFCQWKRGIAAAKGQFIWIAESDDYADSTFLELLVKELRADAAVGLAYCNSIIVNENSTPTGDMAVWKNKFFCTSHWGASFVRDGTAEIKDYLGFTCTINNASAVLFRREAMLQSGGVDDSFRYAGDWLMYLKIALRYRIAYIKDKLNYYRDHSSNVSKQGEHNSRLMVERIMCLGYLHQYTTDNQMKRRIMEQAADEYATIIYSCTRVMWKPKMLGGYVKRIFKFNTFFALRLQANVAIRIMKGESKREAWPFVR